eukprot:5932456-Prymnesium_polylepis.2
MAATRQNGGTGATPFRGGSQPNPPTAPCRRARRSAIGASPVDQSLFLSARQAPLGAAVAACARAFEDLCRTEGRVSWARGRCVCLR